MQSLNKRRAGRAQRIIVESGYADGIEMHLALSDVLVDLRHLAASLEVDFESLLTRSRREFETEAFEDGPETSTGGSQFEFDNKKYEEVSLERQPSHAGVERQNLPLQQQSADDFAELFESVNELTCILIINGELYSISPNMPAATELANAALTSDVCVCSDQDEGMPLAYSQNRISVPQVYGLIRDRVDEMHRKDTDFVLIWRVHGYDTVYVDTSASLAHGEWQSVLGQYF